MERIVLASETMLRVVPVSGEVSGVRSVWPEKESKRIKLTPGFGGGVRGHASYMLFPLHHLSEIRSKGNVYMSTHYILHDAETDLFADILCTRGYQSFARI